MKVALPIAFIMMTTNKPRIAKSIEEPVVKSLIEKMNERTQNLLDYNIFNNNCTDDSDCELPFRCCENLFTNYCCTENGKGYNLRKRVFPNITLPPVQIPLPLPVPQPIPIPIPESHTYYFLN